MSIKDPKSGIIKALYKKIANKPIQDAEICIQGWMGELDFAMRTKALAMKVKSFQGKTPKAMNKDHAKIIKEVREMFDILEDLSGKEAMDFLWALDNAIKIHKRKKIDKYKISDL